MAVGDGRPEWAAADHDFASREQLPLKQDSANLQRRATNFSTALPLAGYNVSSRHFQGIGFFIHVTELSPYKVSL